MPSLTSLANGNRHDSRLRRLRRAFLLLLPAAVAAAPVNPRLTGEPFTRIWRKEDLAGTQQYRQFLVAPDGMVYAATAEGVIQFDGEHWRRIPMPRRGDAMAMALDAEGRIWAAGFDDIACLEPGPKGAFRTVSMTERLAPADRAIGAVPNLIGTADGIYAYALTDRVLLFRPDGSAAVWPVPPQARFGAQFWSLDGILYANLGELFRARASGLERIGAAEPLVFAARREAPGQDAVLLTEKGPMLWAGPGRPFRPFPTAVAALFGGDQAHAAVFLSDGGMAFATRRSGVLILDRAGRLVRRFDRDHSILGNRIYDLALDAEGGLWVGMQEGIMRVDIGSPLAVDGPNEGMIGAPYRGAAWRGSLYFSSSAGLMRRDSSTGRFHRIAGIDVGVNRPLVVGSKLVGVAMSLFEVRPDDTSREWKAPPLDGAVADARHPGWIYGGDLAGLWLFRPQDGGGWAQEGTLEKFPLMPWDLLTRDDGWVWAVGRDGRVARIDFRAGPGRQAPFHVFTPAEGIPLASADENVTVVPLGRDILAVSASWIRRFDPAAGRFFPETRIALDRAPIRGALLAGPSATGGAWIRPADDPSRILRAEASAGGTVSLASYSIAPVHRVSLSSLFEETATHSLWLSGQTLLASYDLAWRPRRPVRAPRALVRRLATQAGEELFGGDGAWPAPRLGPAQNALRFEFAAPSYAADDEGEALTLYRTRMDGLDSDWSPWTRRSERDFTNLPYRSLRFRVQARLPGNAPGPETAFAFSIAPPFWLTGWAWCCYALLALLGVVTLIHDRTFRLQLRNAELAELVAARTAQLERLNQELTDTIHIIGHDLRGGVSGIRSLSGRLRSAPNLLSSSAGAELLGVIERTSGSLVDLMSRLLDLQRVNDRAAGLMAVRTDVAGVIREVARQFETAAATKKIELRVEAPPAVRLVDPDGLASVVSNLIGNAIKFLPADGRGTVTVSLALLPGRCQLTVADNGPGIPAAERASVFEKFARGTARPTAGEASTGVGLFMVKKLVAAMGGGIEIADTPGGGATFIASWPALETP